MDDDKLNVAKSETMTIDQLIEELVRTPEQRQTYLRTGWIHTIIMQLIHHRVDAGLTQKELGERMGKQQSAIARLERGDDLKLSTLFDYLAALDLAPAGQIPTISLEEAVERTIGRKVDQPDASTAAKDKLIPGLAAD